MRHIWGLEVGQIQAEPSRSGMEPLYWYSQLREMPGKKRFSKDEGPQGRVGGAPHEHPYGRGTGPPVLGPLLLGFHRFTLFLPKTLSIISAGYFALSAAFTVYAALGTPDLTFCTN